MQPQKPVHAANERPQHLTATIRLPGMWLKLVPLLHESNLRTAWTNGMVVLSHESSKVNLTLSSLALSQKSCNIRGQLTHVKIKTTGSVGRLNLSVIDGVITGRKHDVSWQHYRLHGPMHIFSTSPQITQQLKNAQLKLTNCCSFALATSSTEVCTKWLTSHPPPVSLPVFKILLCIRLAQRRRGAL